MADDNNIALQQALLERARREKARRAQAQAQSGPGLLGSIYENVIGSGAADTPGEKAGELIKGLGSGAMRGITELVGLPGSAMQGIDYLTRRAGLIPEEYRSPVAEAMSGAGLRRGLEQVTGGASEYAAPGTAGKFAGTVGEFVGGGVGGKLKPLVAGGLASEAAGQMTEGTAAEPYARVAGGFAGPMVGQARSGCGLRTFCLNTTSLSLPGSARGLMFFVVQREQRRPVRQSVKDSVKRLPALFSAPLAFRPIVPLAMC
jgi:hypothetical protein